ncbi:MAG TPA: peptidase [Cytophagales bacterium]|nr:peptidase [Cytophagales bacterium]
MQPVIDLHCDLLAYLLRDPERSLNNPALGCSLPHMHAGGVKVQVCAIFTDVVPESPGQALKQAQIFQQLPQHYPGEVVLANELGNWEEATERDEITLIASIESAAGLCNETQPLSDTVANLDRILELTGSLAYISLTHHKRNRFGGGDYEPGPLTADGKYLVDAMAERNIPICFSHTSDELAETILAHLDTQEHDLPILASHSNYREICQEARNLPDHLAKAIAERGGIIGLNVLRKFMHPTDPEGLYQHVAHAQMLGLENSVVFGADYFFTQDMPEAARAQREPFYLKEHEDATFYPTILGELSSRFSESVAKKVAFDNALAFFHRFISLV